MMVTRWAPRPVMAEPPPAGEVGEPPNDRRAAAMLSLGGWWGGFDGWVGGWV